MVRPPRTAPPDPRSSAPSHGNPRPARESLVRSPVGVRARTRQETSYEPVPARPARLPHRPRRWLLLVRLWLLLLLSPRRRVLGCSSFLVSLFFSFFFFFFF